MGRPSCLRKETFSVINLSSFYSLFTACFRLIPDCHLRKWDFFGILESQILALFPREAGGPPQCSTNRLGKETAVQKFIPSYNGTLRSHLVEVPSCISACSGIRVFGRRIKSVVFSTDVSIIKNINGDAIIAVYPFTPQPHHRPGHHQRLGHPGVCGRGGRPDQRAPVGAPGGLRRAPGGPSAWWSTRPSPTLPSPRSRRWWTSP